MKAPPRLTLPAALTAAVLAITTLTPVAALEEAATTRSTTLSEERQGNLVSKVVESDGEIVSTLVDATTGGDIAFVDDLLSFPIWLGAYGGVFLVLTPDQVHEGAEES